MGVTENGVIEILFCKLQRKVWSKTVADLTVLKKNGAGRSEQQSKVYSCCTFPLSSQISLSS